MLGAVVGYDVGADRVVALTFDDGPNPPYTLPILDALDEYNARATFFLLGRNAALFPEVALEIVRRGHVVGSHTYNHTRLTDLGRANVAQEIRSGKESVRRATGKNPRFFRPPHGVLDLDSFVMARLIGFRPVLWTASGQDWLSITGDEVAKRVLNETSPGSIILLHDGYQDVTDAEASDRSRTVTAVRTLLEALATEGYQFMTLSEMSRFPERRVYFVHARR